MMVSSGGGAARGARWLRQLHHRMISRTLRAAVRHPIRCRAAVRGGLARPGSPATPLPPSAAAAAAAAAPTRGAAAAKALASLEMAPDHLEGRADPGAGPPERTAPGTGPALTRPNPCAWGGGGAQGPYMNISHRS